MDRVDFLLKPPWHHKQGKIAFQELQILGGPQGCLDAIGNVDFLEDVIQVGFHRVRTDAKLVGNFLIGRSDGDHGEYLDLSFG